MSTFKIIVAYEKTTKIIGDNGIPWSNKNDMRHFAKTTIGTPPKGKQNAVIMGRKTWESLPKQPLPDRINIILTNNSRYLIYDSCVMKFTSLSIALNFCRYADYIHEVYVIGGGAVYETAITNPLCKEIIATELVMDEIPDKLYTYFPQIPNNYKEASRTQLSDIEIVVYKNLYNSTSDEMQYLNALQKIMVSGNEKPNRTTIDTKSIFGVNLHFTMGSDADGNTVFPLITTKRMFVRGIIEELLFFLRGSVNNDELQKKGVHIWDGNTTREFLDSRNLHHMEEGSLGKAYGFQWRHWGAEWRGKTADYTNCGIDQISQIIEQLKTDPFSRRIVLSAWNAGELDEMCLPPCHCMYIFNVQVQAGVPKLYCHMTQRSGDMFLGIPFNIASTALLLIILAKTAGLVPGGISISIADAHIYKNHIPQVVEQLYTRTPYYFPKMRLNKNISTIADIEALQESDFTLIDYNYHPAIRADMVI